MKKFKIAIMTLAILFSLGAAFASRPAQTCQGQLYYFNGTTYVPAGIYGVTYICSGSSGTCTYYFSGGVYSQCQTGSYTPMGFRENSK